MTETKSIEALIEGYLAVRLKSGNPLYNLQSSAAQSALWSSIKTGHPALSRITRAVFLEAVESHVDKLLVHGNSQEAHKSWLDLVEPFIIADMPKVLTPVDYLEGRDWGLFEQSFVFVVNTEDELMELYPCNCRPDPLHTRGGATRSAKPH